MVTDKFTVVVETAGLNTRAQRRIRQRGLYPVADEAVSTIPGCNENSLSKLKEQKQLEGFHAQDQKHIKLVNQD